MYQVSLKGYFETENPDELVKAITKVAEDNKAEMFGQFAVFHLAPYVDYQKVDVTDPQDNDTTI